MRKIMFKLVFFICLLLFISPSFTVEKFNIAPNATYEKVVRDKLVYHITKVDMDPLLEIETIISQNRLSEILKYKNYDLIINGNFFDPKTFEPVGLVIKNGELIHLPIKRGIFGLTFDNKPIIDIFNINLKIKVDENIIPINAINSPRGIDGINIFTRYFGKETQIRENASAGVDIEVALEDKIPSLGKTSGVITNIYYGVKRTPIKENTCIISLGGTSLKYLPLFSVEKKLEIISECTPQIPLKEAIGGGPILLKNKEIVLGKTEELPFDDNIVNSRHPRTIIGTKENSIYFIVIEGRKESSIGVTLKESCEILKEMGISDAINMDGGGSSQKLIWGKLMNQEIERPIPVALGIRNVYPYTQPKYLAFTENDDIYIKKGDKIKVELLLQDENYHPYPIDTSMLTWTFSNPILNFDISNMTLEGIDLGESLLTLNLNGLTTTKKIFVWDFVNLEINTGRDQFFLGDTFIPKVYVVDNFNRKIELPIENLKFDPKFFIKNREKFTAINVGKTNLEYTFNNLWISVPIEIFDKKNIIFEDFEIDKNWIIKGKNYDISSTTYTLTSDSYSGNSAISVTYSSQTNNSFIYLELNILVPQNITKFSISLKGSGEGWIRALFYDNDNQPWVIDITNTSSFDFPKWTVVEIDLKDLKPLTSKVLVSPVFPIKLESIYVVGLNQMGVKGKLIIDTIRFY
jgi:hypothetical protein